MKLNSEQDFSAFIRNYPLCAIYFSGPDCAVCAALKPKLFELLQYRFPKLVLGEVDCSTSQQLASQQLIFSIPTLIVYLDGREAIRKSRSFSLTELVEELDRPYGIVTSE
jgi:thioredoxin-like negative regulator of GroEL